MGCLLETVANNWAWCWASTNFISGGGLSHQHLKSLRALHQCQNYVTMFSIPRPYQPALTCNIQPQWCRHLPIIRQSSDGISFCPSCNFDTRNAKSSDSLVGLLFFLLVLISKVCTPIKWQNSWFSPTILDSLRIHICPNLIALGNCLVDMIKLGTMIKSTWATWTCISICKQQMYLGQVVAPHWCN